MEALFKGGSVTAYVRNNGGALTLLRVPEHTHLP